MSGKVKRENGDEKEQTRITDTTRTVGWTQTQTTAE